MVGSFESPLRSTNRPNRTSTVLRRWLVNEDQHNLIVDVDKKDNDFVYCCLEILKQDNEFTDLMICGGCVHCGDFIVRRRSESLYVDSGSVMVLS